MTEAPNLDLPLRRRVLPWAWLAIAVGGVVLLHAADSGYVMWLRRDGAALADGQRGGTPWGDESLGTAEMAS